FHVTGVQTCALPICFALIDFATEVRGFREGMVDATAETISAALGYVEGMRARGGTDIHGALLRALELPGKEGRPFMIVFITDGRSEERRVGKGSGTW